MTRFSLARGVLGARRPHSHTLCSEEQMIAISQHSEGSCENCTQKPAVYSIHGDPDEWTGPSRVCQACMLGLIGTSEQLRYVLLLQGGVLTSIGGGS